MKRLLQALSNRLYPGDLVRNESTSRDSEKIHFVKEVRRLKGRDMIVVINAYGFSNHFTTEAPTVLTKLKRMTFRNEWRLLMEQGSLLNLKRVQTLEERCNDRNIGYLYKEMIASKGTDQFQMNMDLINRMLNDER